MAVDISVLYGYLTSGEWLLFFQSITNYYMPYALFYMLIGVVLFTVVQIKTGNMGYASIVSIIYFVYMFGISELVVSAFATFWLKIFGIIIALAVIALIIYGLIKQR